MERSKQQEPSFVAVMNVPSLITKYVLRVLPANCHYMTKNLTKKSGIPEIKTHGQNNDKKNIGKNDIAIDICQKNTISENICVYSLFLILQWIYI